MTDYSHITEISWIIFAQTSTQLCNATLPNVEQLVNLMSASNSEILDYDIGFDLEN